ncbi:MAG: DNA replication/repair protein RecF [Gammaproteobacteria bacterium]|nr:DNA replication/repair protein RecF [Gammaproteobacteria bacterium]
MHHIVISHFRNIESARLDFPKTGYCLISGSNGSGKTSILEAIHVLTRGKSFRASDSSQIIQHDHNSFTLSAVTWKDSERIGVQRDRQGKTVVKAAGECAKFLDIALKIPLRMMSPIESYALVNGGPEQRRRFLDWGMFHVKHSYWSELKKLNRILKQKNAALKMRCSDSELTQWNIMLAEISYSLDVMRIEYLQQLEQVFSKYREKLSLLKEVRLCYCPGWSRESTDLFTQLSTAMRQERQQGYCLIGPHRADVRLEIPYGLCKDQLSRGQQKMLALALYLAQGEHLFELTGSHPLYMVDDFSSELDLVAQELLIDALDPSDKQIIITSLTHDIPLSQKLSHAHDLKRYVIENGKVYECFGGQPR